MVGEGKERIIFVGKADGCIMAKESGSINSLSLRFFPRVLDLDASSSPFLLHASGNDASFFLSSSSTPSSQPNSHFSWF